MLKPFLQPFLQPSLQSVFALNKVTQYLVQLSASAGSYYKTNIELKAGYRVEIVAQMDSGAYRYLCDGDIEGATRAYLYISSNGTLQYNASDLTNLTVDGIATPVNTNVQNDGKLHTIEFTLGFDKTLATLFARYTGRDSLDQIGELIRVYDETDKLIVDLDFKQPPDTRFIPNLAQPLGDELYSDNPFATANGGTVTKLTSDSWSVQTPYGGLDNLAYGARIQSFPVTPNESYLFKVNSNEDVNVLAYNSAYQLISRGVNEVLFTTSETFVRLYVAPRTTNAVIFKKASIKEAPHWAEAVNIPDENYLPVTWDAGRNAWEMGVPVLNGTFDSSSDWTLGTGWSINNGRADLVSDGSPSNLRQNDVFELGKTYLVQFDVQADTADIGFQGSGGVIVASARSGTVRVVWVADTTFLAFKRTHGSPTGWIDNVSVKRLVEVAQ